MPLILGSFLPRVWDGSVGTPLMLQNPNESGFTIFLIGGGRFVLFKGSSEPAV